MKRKRTCFRCGLLHLTPAQLGKRLPYISGAVRRGSPAAVPTTLPLRKQRQKEMIGRFVGVVEYNGGMLHSQSFYK